MLHLEEIVDRPAGVYGEPAPPPSRTLLELVLPLAQARRALMRFPGVGAPGAEKILLLGRSHPVLGLDSNGVRVLTRVGVVKEESSYAATYRNVQSYVSAYSDRGFDWLIRAHQLLLQHGQ